MATLSNHSIAGATSDTYTIPVNSVSNSGATPGDQGFNLKSILTKSPTCLIDGGVGRESKPAIPR
ncbi:hypothetical protein [Budvicia aquatica]|uniref:hypothetical protein n=1 Tax=Budvicia aquatica TaxID=82979 RepID=UPI002100F592|nr:hypothetical protein [Budvicia aquatica]